MSNDTQQFAWQVHGYLNGYIKFGDTKAALLAGLTGPLIVGLVGVSGWKLKWDWETFFLLISIGLLAIAFCFAFMAIWPNLFTDKVKSSKTRKTSIESSEKEIPDVGFVYWKNIRAHVNANTFADALVNLTEEERLKHIGNHCYELAGITDRKYWFISISSRFFAGALIALVLFAVIHCGNISKNDGTDNANSYRQIPSRLNGGSSTAVQPISTADYSYDPTNQITNHLLKR